MSPLTLGEGARGSSLHNLYVVAHNLKIFLMSVLVTFYADIRHALEETYGHPVYRTGVALLRPMLGADHTM